VSRMGTSLIESLRTAIDDILGPILAGTRRVALLDFPTHANVGDSAIWLGTLAYLREKGKVVCYSCDHDTYSRDTLAERLDDGIILLSGGGNFGDIWKQPQRLREQVVREHNHGRRRIEEVGQLKRSYARGRGALLTKYLLRADRAMAYCFYYDLRWNGRELVRALRAWSSPRTVVERGWHMLAGAVRWVDTAHLPAPVTSDEAPSLAPRALLSSPVEPS
jgi:hypothetical protein